ncbi:MAG: membrane protein insertase YidC [Gammaproteobacteria bacterium]|nr:membrane protein insertase YidC [Gammaproteobacteria bacterium]
MDIKRIVLYVAFAVVAVFLLHTWEREYPQRLAKEVTSAQKVASTAATPSSAAASKSEPAATVAAMTHAAKTTNKANQTPSNQLIHVTTNLYNFVIDPNNGRVTQVDLKQYPVSLHSKQPFTLLNNDNATHYTAGSYLTGVNGRSNTPLNYTSAKTAYVMHKGDKQLAVVLQAKSHDGLQVTKIFTFHRNSYLVDIDYHITNHSSQAQSTHLAVDIARAAVAPPRDKTFRIHAFYGFALSTPGKHYQKYKFSTLSKEAVNQQAKGGWLAMTEHYFLTAWIPNPALSWHYSSTTNRDGIYIFTAQGPATQIAPQATVNLSAKLYTGPKITANLNAAAAYLNMTIDYGWLWPISRLLFKLMSFIHLLVHNWGWSVVITTALIKLAFWHLSAKSYRSMAGMRTLQPKMAALKESCGDNKQRFSKEMMILYKREKINPLGGCLPIAVQIPFFIALYWVLIASVQLRQTPFIFWIHDLSAKDPFYILPILMGVSMFIQQRLSPPATDPTQAKMMMFMPVFITALFINFPAGLILYMLVNNIISVSQQWWIIKHYTGKPKTKKNKSIAWKKTKQANRKNSKR